VKAVSEQFNLSRRQASRLAALAKEEQLHTDTQRQTRGMNSAKA
jgi:hypothetical protein